MVYSDVFGIVIGAFLSSSFMKVVRQKVYYARQIKDAVLLRTGASNAHVNRVKSGQ